jgi:hypothetical protein
VQIQITESWCHNWRFSLIFSAFPGKFCDDTAN